MWDTLILGVMALVVFGPRRLPQLARQLGKIMYEFRKASNDFKYQMEAELRQAEEADRRKQEEERQRALTAAAAPSEAPPADSPTNSAPAAEPAAESVAESIPADPYAARYPEYASPDAFQTAATAAPEALKNAAPTEEQHG